ncbi:hypothetical protein NEPTK9_000625 [Candidatus Neptunochlamydia vexilliferae]|uniref:Uncharacterized protein n=1 Tax=Candidatus Neptunichlamydia vexilliferae TaxID=1651774 RepID=A0ABS0AYA5_9BACT|nr:hypothetical protein [Candidatus Neptunochlamydia vexilliferae]
MACQIEAQGGSRGLAPDASLHKTKNYYPILNHAEFSNIFDTPHSRSTTYSKLSRSCNKADEDVMVAEMHELFLPSS